MANKMRISKRSLIWLIPLLLSLLYPPMQRSLEDYGRVFDGWGPFWHIFNVDFDGAKYLLDVGDFIEGEYSIEWGVLLWQWVTVLLLWAIYSAVFGANECVSSSIDGVKKKSKRDSAKPNIIKDEDLPPLNLDAISDRIRRKP